jgi:mono/diheme cytochrome c family protein
VKACVLGLYVIAVGMSLGSAEDRGQPPWEKNHLRVGQALYRENCVVCHDIDGFPSRKPGPSFYQLFKHEKMPVSNVKPNREYIKVRVKFGGSLMPAFRQWLTEKQIDTLIDYMASR